MDIKNKKLIEELSEPLETVSDDNIISDVNGSYTGYPKNGKHPIQDADDL